ncbi:MAG: ABC transporter substrate-binding protein [Nocardioidaceae bacterium]
MRSWKALAAAALLPAGLVACAPSTSDSDDSGGGESTTLQVWSWRTEDVDEYNKIFDAFEKENDGITVEFKAFTNTEYNTILATGLTEEKGPDVAALRAYGGLQPLCEADRLLALDDVDVSAIGDEVLAGARCQSDDKLYGVPFATQVMAVYYNKTIFDDNGIEEPTSWQELVDAAKTLKSAGVTPFATTGKDTWMLPIVHDLFAAPRYGGPEFEEAVLAGDKDFTDPDYVASLDVVKELEPYFPKDVAGVDYTTSQTLFTSGKAAMFPGGSFELAFFQQQNPDLEMGVFPVPPPPDSLVDHSLTPGWVDASYGVNAKSDNKEAATKLVEWIATKDFGQLLSDELKQINPVEGVAPSDPLLNEMVELYGENPAAYLLLVNFRYGEPGGTDLLGAGLQSMLLGDKDAKAAAADLQKGVAQWFEPAG